MILVKVMQLALRVYLRSSTGSRPASTLRSVQWRKGRLWLGGLAALGAAGAGIQYWRADFIQRRKIRLRYDGVVRFVRCTCHLIIRIRGSSK